MPYAHKTEKIVILAATPRCGNLPLIPFSESSMKLHLDQTGSTNIITGYGADHLMINKVRHDGNLIVTDAEIHTGWAAGGFEQLCIEDITRLCELDREIVLIGTGKRQRFPAPHLLRPLMEARIGFEIMDLAAACRTYNVLVGEGRAVAAALLFDPI